MFIYGEPTKMIVECLSAFLKSTNDSNFTITVIDNYPRRDAFDRESALIINKRVNVHFNLLNQSQARNWNQATRLTLMDKHEMCGIIAPDTIVSHGWLEKIETHISAGGKLRLFNHLNFSVFHAPTIMKLGWFDERHVSGGSEDLDMYCRLEEANIPYDRTFLREFERRGTSNQYRDTSEHYNQFKRDTDYWRRKWSPADPESHEEHLLDTEQLMFHAESRRRNWSEIDWYPKVLDRDAYDR
jgi:hypothetical protein